MTAVWNDDLFGALRKIFWHRRNEVGKLRFVTLLAKGGELGIIGTLPAKTVLRSKDDDGYEREDQNDSRYQAGLHLPVPLNTKCGFA